MDNKSCKESVHHQLKDNHIKTNHINEVSDNYLLKFIKKTTKKFIKKLHYVNPKELKRLPLEY